MAASMLDKNGLGYFWSKVKTFIQTTVSDLASSVDNKVDKVDGKGLSTNDFTNVYKNELIRRFNYSRVSVYGGLASGWQKVSTYYDLVEDNYPKLLNDIMIMPMVTSADDSLPTTGDIFIGKGIVPGYDIANEKTVYGVCYGLAIRFDYTGETPQVETLSGEILYYFSHTEHGWLYIYTGRLPTPSIINPGVEFFYASKTVRYTITGSHSSGILY